MINIGYAEADITPIDGEPLCGFALRQGPVTGVHDPLKCRWLALHSHNDNSYLLGSADIISLSRGRHKTIQKSIEAECNVKPAHIALATTHTHSGPATVPLRYAGKMNNQYMHTLKSRLKTSACGALKASRNRVNVSIGSSNCNLAVNRRNPESGPVDHEVITYTLSDANTGATRATIVNYACHPVVLGYGSNMVSADYPGYLASYIEKETGAPCLYLNGACGDLNPQNAHKLSAAEARKSGESLAKKALAAASKSRIVESNSVRLISRTVNIPVHQPKSEKELEGRLRMLHERFGIEPALFADRVAQSARQLQQGRYPKQIALQLSLLMIGNECGVLFVPGELFCSIGLRMKALFAPRKIMIAGFSNGSIGYLPDRQAYADGGYEPHFANFFYGYPEFEPSLEDDLLAGAAWLQKSADQNDCAR